jgi:hypothetical protein
LTQWLPGGANFRFIDNAIVHPPAAVAMVEEDQVRNGWYFHPQIGIQDKQSVIDIGSRYGEYTLPVLAMHDETHVYAFEKDPRLVKALRENLRMNKSFPERCSVLNRIISPIDTTIDSYIFDELSTPPHELKFIKIDVGGQDELNICIGAYKTIEHYRPINILMHLYGGMPEFNRFTEQFLVANQFDCKSVVTQLDKEDELICNTLIY